MMEINGIAHIFLTASNYQISREFYRKLLPFLGLLGRNCGGKENGRPDLWFNVGGT